jgi:hypothetical protein
MTTLAIGCRGTCQPIASVNACSVRTRKTIDALAHVIAASRWTYRGEFDGMTRQGIAIGASTRDIVRAYILIVGTLAPAADSAGTPAHASDAGNATRAACAAHAAIAGRPDTRTAAARRAFDGRFGLVRRREWIDFASIEHHCQTDDTRRGQKNALFHNLASLKLTNVRK